MTDGASGWIPLMAGVSSVVVMAILYGVVRSPIFGNLRFSRIGWKHVGVVAVIAVFIQAAIIHQTALSSFTKYVSGVSGTAWTRFVSSWDWPDPSLQYTRPVCNSNDCSNFNFYVDECKLQAVDVGSLSSRRGRSGQRMVDLVIATKHFRSCLVEHGFSWAPCKRGESECDSLPSYTTK